jgi:hypothetical protein
MFDEEDFRKLVAGEVVSLKPGCGLDVEVKIALADIGFDRMHVAIRDALGGTIRDTFVKA